ncbi:MAG: DUF1573 domain-containing protein [Akkermansiaceae bacterium]|nr:DUF1573 domain-containing protein [Armatimonadota bacterium]
MCVIILLYRLPIASNRLYLSQSEYRFGSVTAGTEIRRVATVRNLHPWSVRVQSLRGDCGCTRAFVGKTEPFTLKPLEAIQVAATVDTTGKSGSVTQNVYIVTDDNPQGTPITLSGIVTPAQPKGN